MISKKDIEEISKSRIKSVAEKGVHILESINEDDDDWNIFDDEWENSLPLKITPYDVFGDEINFKNNELRTFLPDPNQIPLCLILPFYDKVIFELPNWNPNQIKKHTGFTLNELSILMEENRVGVLIHSDMSVYQKEVLNKLITKPNSICLSLNLWLDLFFKGEKPVNEDSIKISDEKLKPLFTSIIKKVKHWGLNEEWANEYYARGEEFISILKLVASESDCKRDISKIDKKKCTPCILSNSLNEYLDRLRAISLKSILQYSYPSGLIYSHFDPIPIKSECKIEILPINYIDMMLKEFDLIYTPDIPLDRYLDIIDSSTGKSLKNIINSAYEGGVFNPTKFIDNLRSFKQDILDLTKRRNKKILLYSSTSEIGKTTLEKIHSKTIFGGSEQLKNNISEWFFQKTKPLIGKALGKKPDLIQIHHTIKRLNKIKIENILK